MPSQPWGHLCPFRDWYQLSENSMSKGKEKYIKDKIEFINEFKLINQKNKFFANVIDNIITEYIWDIDFTSKAILIH